MQVLNKISYSINTRVGAVKVTSSHNRIELSYKNNTIEIARANKYNNYTLSDNDYEVINAWAVAGTDFCNDAFIAFEMLGVEAWFMRWATEIYLDE